MTNIRHLRPAKGDALLERPAEAQAHRPGLRLANLDAPALKNVMQSMTAMSQAQLRRFDASGVVVFLFDGDGLSVMSIERPDRGGVSDQHIRASIQQFMSGNAEEIER